MDRIKSFSIFKAKRLCMYKSKRHFHVFTSHKHNRQQTSRQAIPTFTTLALAVIGFSSSALAYTPGTRPFCVFRKPDPKLTRAVGDYWCGKVCGPCQSHGCGCPNEKSRLDPQLTIVCNPARQ